MSRSRRISPELQAAQDEWYARLKKDGFEDIEDHSSDDKPLKRWSGITATVPSEDGRESISIIDIFAHQEHGIPIQSSFPEKRFIKEERLLNRADFDDICGSVCGHRNHKLVSGQVREIWELYLEGETNRAIAKAININNVTVYRCIASLTKWAETMGEETAISTVIVREYDKERDAPMLFATWRNALWFDTTGRDESLNHKFFRDCTKLIKSILAGRDARVQIACLSDDPDLILGVSVMNKDNLVWVYVKADYRARGIATMLAKGAKTFSKPSTRIGKAIVKNKELKIHGED